MTAPEFVSVTVFAEDIRHEVGGQVSIIGVFPDNLAVAETPSLMPKLALYTRSVFSTKIDLTTDLVCKLIGPDGAEMATNVTPLAQIQEALEDSRRQGADLLTMVSQMQASPFPITSTGRIKLMAHYGNIETLSGFLNISTDLPTSNS